MEWRIPSLEKTQQAAADFLASCTPTSTATVVALHGDLGAGKTTFIQALAAALGVDETVTSPTFVIMKSYDTTAPWEQLVHIDAYRIENIEELSVLGFNDVLANANTLVCIEWAERVAELLPADTIHLTFTGLADERTITST